MPDYASLTDHEQEGKTVAEESGRAAPGEAGGADTVTAPDQHKPINLRLVRIGGVLAIFMLLVMTQPFNNHANSVDDVFLVLIAGAIALLMGVDAVLRRNGLRR